MNIRDQTILVTGGAGFIGSAMIRFLINNTAYKVVNIDKLTYAGHLESLEPIVNNEGYFFEQEDICNKQAMHGLFDKYKPVGVIHLAAESHVDRSITGSDLFIQTNIIGTYNLLEASRNYYDKASDSVKSLFRFLHVSTDEVFGSLTQEGFFNESTAYSPRSPYSASKASSDLLVNAWHHTYNLPTVITNCTNNYGPYHYPEKLIPLTINNALQLKSIPIYGSGNNVRDWLYVDDHVAGIFLVFKNGKLGESYCIGGHNERTNYEVVTTICKILDELKPNANIKSYADLIIHTEDRLGHDYRYAIDSTKLTTELNWVPNDTFETGIRKTILWYLDNQKWIKEVM